MVLCRFTSNGRHFPLLHFYLFTKPRFPCRLLCLIQVVGHFVLSNQGAVVRRRILCVRRAIFPKDSPNFVLDRFSIPMFHDRLGRYVRSCGKSVANCRFRGRVINLLLHAFPTFRARRACTAARVSHVRGGQRYLCALFQCMLLLLGTVLRVFPPSERLIRNNVFR